MPCEAVLRSKCPSGHPQSRKCHENLPPNCKICDREAKAAADKQEEAFELQKKRDIEQQAHDKKIAELEAKIAAERQRIRDIRLDKERQDAIRQKERDLEDAKSFSNRATTANEEPPEPPRPASKTPTTPTQTTKPSTAKPNITATATPPPDDKTPSQLDWEREKKVEGARNDAIDAIMDMIGLESVKKQVLRIKSKIAVTRRQNTSLKDERFNIVLLGNPGTGEAYLDIISSLSNVLCQEKQRLQGTMLSSSHRWMFFQEMSLLKLPVPLLQTTESPAQRSSSKAS